MNRLDMTKTIRIDGWLEFNRTEIVLIFARFNTMLAKSQMMGIEEEFNN